MSDATHSIRVFLGLWPQDTARNQLDKLVRQLADDCTGRRIQPKNLHLTLAFIGKIDRGNISRLCQAALAIRQSSFMLTLDKVCFWKKAGVVVAGASQCPSELISLVQDLQHLLATLKIGYDDTHPFTPHVTLLRNARHCGLPDSIQAIDWLVTRWSLTQSRQTPYGSVYQSLADWALEPQDSDEHYRT
ncbi:RNA 2',3'-cyclic phosphodiesterase [Nitrosomonas sp. HPC101]|uniref:RNA 2',3'-cyclic phosphodiesterase n=1 Tax=Nitrosomonas sp. HPC101 TaxID=1658667 RepID=UPI00136F6788|nr:RNA 2',3'-cyclic phosphodiesterase [Nitrosomonas sp. HPC101]MXS84439.1 RNA 2',3'-cyclic phosphodiesterase [Nitrosomonas sp. HPC101]